MLRLSFSPPRELGIEGSRVDFRQLSKALRRIGSNALDSIEVAADPAARADGRVLSELRVRVGDGLVRVAVEDAHVVATGSRGALAKLATWFEFDPSEPDGSRRAHVRGAASETIDAESV